MKIFSLKSKGQATLELCFALIGILLILLASFKIMVWINERLILKQELYEHSRISAGSGWHSDPELVDESGLPPLRIFSK